MRDEYAKRVIQAGIDLDITPRGIVIAFATVFVESGWKMYANPADPESLRFPHEALSYDANSVGMFQQRAEWWGTCAQRMDPYESAVMFFNSLKRYPYRGAWGTPGYWAQRVQQSAYPDRYDQHFVEAQALYDRLAWVKPEGAMEKRLDYSRNIVPQEHSWDCGPATAQIILASQGIAKTEQWLIDRIGTNTSGTNHTGLITPILNELLPGSGYKVVWLPKDPPTKAQTEQLWKDVVRSIDSNRGVVLNFVAPPNNFPRGTRGDSSPEYRGSNTIFHYVAGMGYADDGPGGRHIWIADPGFRPHGFWCSLEQVASLITPHSYGFAATASTTAPAPTPIPVPTPAPVKQPESELDALKARVERLSDALSILLRIIEQDHPEILSNYIQATTKG